MNSCYNCKAILTYFTPLYYCCIETRPLCRRCRPFSCEHCKKSNWKEIREKVCRVCRRKLGGEQGLKEVLCGDHYCPRCLSNIYLPYFLKKKKNSMVQMNCGHMTDRLEIQALFNQHCINCGSKFKSNFDYPLQGGMRLCNFCFQYEGRKFQQFLQRCLGCTQILNSSEMTHSQVLLCKQCCESQAFIEQSFANSNLAQTNQASIISGLKSQKLNTQKYYEEQPSEDLSIVSRFSAFEIQDQEKKKKNRFTSMKTLSKNSVEIRVQNFRLPSVVKQDCNMVRCELCNILVCLDGTLPNTTYSKTNICKMCFAQTFDRSYLSYSRQAYHQSYIPAQRINSLHKNTQPVSTTMKSSMVSQISNAPILSTITSPPKLQPGRADKKQPWEIASNVRNPCEICQKKSSIITRTDKKKVCAECANKYR